MTNHRLDILYVSPMPPSPPRFGAQARMHGLGKSLAERHDVTAFSLVDPSFDAEEAQTALRDYCKDVAIFPTPGGDGGGKRFAQVLSLFSGDSYQRRRFAVPGLQAEFDRLLQARRYDLVFLHFPYLAHYRLRQAPAGTALPAVVIDSHDIGYDLARQVSRSRVGLGRRTFAAFNWKKLAREELSAYREADGVLVCSRADQKRLAADAPTVKTEVIQNAADVDFLKPRPTDPSPDGQTVLFFGLLSTVPNVDGVSFFLKEVWPRIAAARPGARCKIVGAQASASLLALRGPGVEFTGVVVPLRLGSGTRLKIVEAWAMAKPIVSTTLGAEGIDGVPGRDILIADEPDAFAKATVRILDDPAFAKALGEAGRRLAEERYSWRAAGRALEGFMSSLLAGPRKVSAGG
jgi:glycosyltransferase involved in cell wall biosynthesis